MTFLQKANPINLMGFVSTAKLAFDLREQGARSFDFLANLFGDFKRAQFLVKFSIFLLKIDCFDKFCLSAVYCTKFDEFCLIYEL
jgi:hypothetical protein